MTLLRLMLEFFKAGMFAVGGGLATIPFLSDIGLRTGWFTQGELANMIAVSESTPGPIGVNMATYVGFTTAGVAGAVTATLSLVAPSVIIILMVARVLRRFRQSRLVDAAFYGLRPASTALIAAAGVSVAAITLLNTDVLAEGQWGALIRWKELVLAAAVFVGLQLPSLKKLHPVIFIAVSALVGILWRL